MAQNGTVRLWTKSIVIGLVDDVLDRQNADIQVQDTLSQIERTLKQLLDRKVRFRRNCRRYLAVKGQKGMDHDKMRVEIEAYLEQKGERQEQIAVIVQGIQRIQTHLQ